MDRKCEKWDFDLVGGRALLVNKSTPTNRSATKEK